MNSSIKNNHSVRFAGFRGDVSDELVLSGKRELPEGEARIYYSGAISDVRDIPLEAVYATNADVILSLTWGWPRGVGVLEMADIARNAALEELSRAPDGSVLFSASNAPLPKSYGGIELFGARSFEHLYTTIDVLLG